MSRSYSLPVHALTICLVGGLTPVSSAALVDSISTAEAIVGGGLYGPDDGGFRIDWNVSQNTDGTWHYRYDFGSADGGQLARAVSHVILELSDNISENDLFNFENADEVEIGIFGESPSNPGFPDGGSIFGIKIDLFESDLNTLAFDSTRQPHWADFYAKGAHEYAFNSDFGVGVSNPSEFLAPAALDVGGNVVFKVLAPNSMVPAPGALALIAIAGAAGGSRRRR